jgi:chemotaxis protein methyltransferase CheR
MAILNKDQHWDIDSLAAFVSEVVGKESGNVLKENQYSMVVSRMKKRLIDLGNLSPGDYIQYFHANQDKELSSLVTLLTTHYTFFFREFAQFEFISKNLATIVQRVKSRGQSKIKIFCAGASRGHEVYSIATFLEYHLKSFPGMTYEILGTDIDPKCMDFARNGVYLYQEVKSIPQIYLSGNWQRGKGDIARFVKIKEGVKNNCKFDVMNLLHTKSYLKDRKFDLMFCRNVFIYFNEKSILGIVNDLKNHLYPNAYLITGLSESLKGIELFKNTHAPSVYSFDKIENELPKETVARAVPEALPLVTKSPIPSPIRMLIVDDSPSVLKIFTKIFKSDPDFELVGEAKNGIEAQEFLKVNEVDAMTLDIHMPEMDGVEYLKQNFKEGHPKVIVVSSASREDNRYAQKTLEYGAIDFVEKPKLNNLAKRAQEIKNKIKMSFMIDKKISPIVSDVIKKDYVITNCHAKARCVLANFSDLNRVKTFISELKGDQPPLFLFFEGNFNFLNIIEESIKSVTSRVKVFEEGVELVEKNVYICSFDEHFLLIKNYFVDKKVSFNVFGICSERIVDDIAGLKSYQLLLEDMPGINESIKELASDVFPWTSFSHVGTEFLAGD